MSHLKERTEKICLNCNAQIAGPFCHICGQENIEPKESVWHLLTHFFNDITHFDGKFFSTLSLLIRKPGLLPMEYMRGRRASYLNPVRMYIFTSAIFFLVFFSVFHISDKRISTNLTIEGKTREQIRLLTRDSLENFAARINNGQPIPPGNLDQFLDSITNSQGFHLTSSIYKSKEEYDSVLQSGVKKHNWLQRKLIYKEIEANKTYHNNWRLFTGALLSAFIHSFPQILFVSLPVFALFLQLLYRRRKDYYYVSHGIFSIHFYIFVIITMMVIVGINELHDVLHWEWLRFIRGIMGLAIFFYLYKAMRIFYQQRRAKTIFKFLLLNILSYLMIVLLCLVFLLFSFMKV